MTITPPLWNEFLTNRINAALSNHPVLLSTSESSPGKPHSLLGAVQKNSNLMAIANATCGMLINLPDISKDQDLLVGFASFHGVPTKYWDVLEWIMLALLCFLFLSLSDFLSTWVCCEKRRVYYYPDSTQLRTRREVEYSIHAVMNACNNDVGKSHRNKTFDALLFLAMSFSSLDIFNQRSLWISLFQTSLFVYAIYAVFHALSGACSRFSYLRTPDRQRQLVRSLFVSFNQPRTFLMNSADGLDLRIRVSDYSTIPANLICAAIESTFKRLKMNYTKSGMVLCASHIDRVSARQIQMLNIFIFSRIDSHFIGQLIRRQLGLAVRKLNIERTDADGAFAHFTLTLGNVRLEHLKNWTQHLGLKVKEVVNGHSTQVRIQVEHILTHQQLDLLGKVEKAWINNYGGFSHTTSHKVLPRQHGQRSWSGSKAKHQASTRLKQPSIQAAAPLTIEWPCGAQWSSLSQVQSVVPVRAQIPLFLLLCGRAEEYPQGIFELFQTIIQSGPALAPATGNNGVIRVKNTDEARTYHRRNWKLKHVGTDWRIGATEERQSGGRAVLLICNRLYQKGNPSTGIDLTLPEFSPRL